MLPPIIVDARGDVDIYESVEAAQRDVEAVDVRNGAYTFYDREGRILRGVIVPRFREGLLRRLLPVEVVALEPASEPGAGATELRRVLSEFLARVEARLEKPAESCTLDELVDAMRRFATRGS